LVEVDEGFVDVLLDEDNPQFPNKGWQLVPQ
jgi:hypothetical protein